MPVSDDTILRYLRAHQQRRGEPKEVKRLGVDDWAWKKGQRYGTILVDLDRHEVIDLLPDRTSDGLRKWLDALSGVELITRDRNGQYAEAATLGAPEAVQVADRFHLLVNLSGAVERALEGRHSQLLADKPESQTPAPEPAPPSAAQTQQECRKQRRRQRRLERYEKVAEMHAAGFNQSLISETLGIDRRTVRRWIRNGGFPERKLPAPRAVSVDEHAEYLRQRWDQGCRNATTLFTELRSRGYKGGRSMVARYVHPWRKSKQAAKPQRRKQVTPKHAAILACKPDQALSDEQRELLNVLMTNCPELGLMRALAQDFRTAVLGTDSSLLREWISTAKQSGIGALVGFAWGLNRDLAAVTAAVGSTYSNGQVEGQVNRLKTIKRQMYGRAGFSLLRARTVRFHRAAPP